MLLGMSPVALALIAHSVPLFPFVFVFPPAFLPAVGAARFDLELSANPTRKSGVSRQLVLGL